MRPAPASCGSVENDLRKAVLRLFHLICALERLGPSVLAYARPVVVQPAHVLFVWSCASQAWFHAARALDCLRRVLCLDQRHMTSAPILYSSGKSGVAKRC